MSSLVEHAALRAPSLATRSRMRLFPAGPSLWRVLEPGGRVIGHLQAVAQAGGIRFRARRFNADARAFRELGEFWSADDAIDCLIFAR